MHRFITIVFLFSFINTSFAQNLERKALKNFLAIIEDVDIHLNHEDVFQIDKNADKIFFEYYTRRYLERIRKFPIEFNEIVDSKNFIEIDSSQIKIGTYQYVESDSICGERIRIKNIKDILYSDEKSFKKRVRGNEIFIEVSNAIPYRDYFYFTVEIVTRNSWCRNYLYLKMNKKGKLIDWANEYGTI